MFSATSINKICKLFDLELIDVIKQETHGGSLRYVCGRKSEHKISSNVIQILDEEKRLNIDNEKSCLEFKKTVRYQKNLREKIINIKNKGMSISGYAATSKSTTNFELLRYWK